MDGGEPWVSESRKVGCRTESYRIVSCHTRIPRVVGCGALGSGGSSCFSCGMQHVRGITDGPCLASCLGAFGELELLLGQVSGARSIAAFGLAFGSEPRRAGPVLTVRAFTADAIVLLRRALPRSIYDLPVWIEPFVHPYACFWSTPRVAGGCTVRANQIRQGTLGCLVQRGSEVFGLTCEHVLADDSLSVQTGREAYWRDWRRRRVEWRRLGEVCEIGGIDYVRGVAPTDSALIRIECDYARTPLMLRGTHHEPLDEYAAWRQKARVCKVGASSGKTFGRVQAIVHGIAVRTPLNQNHHVQVKYPPLIEIAGETPSLCKPGDSGAMFYLHEPGLPRAPIGLLCSTTYGSKGYAIPMKVVCDAHDVRAI